MAAKYKVPGIYVEEVPKIPTSITEVPTAIPVFIGYTEKALNNGRNLINEAFKINTLSEYEHCFGAAFHSKFDILKPEPYDTRPTTLLNGKDYVIDFKPYTKSFMYASIKLFFANGGQSCYILSVGTFEGKTQLDVSAEDLLGNTTGGGLKRLSNVPEPTIVVIPDAVSLEDECFQVYQHVLTHCYTMQNRFAILDIHNGYMPVSNGPNSNDIITNFRTKIGTNALSFGAAYYPWLHTVIFEKSEVTLAHINLDIKRLSNLLPEADARDMIKTALNSTDLNEKDKKLHLGLLALSPTYQSVIEAILNLMNLLPPSPAMAGIYTSVDVTRGVWKAPANVSVASVIKPAVNINNNEQAYLNIDAVSGKSINAIRLFPGRGTLVWGSRTLDGNHNEFRYINVKRTIITFQQSISLALRAYSYEPNNANTWTRIESMITNYLNQKWRQGALAGASPNEAFGVNVGLGSSMTNTDILEGRLNVIVYVALLRPAEFIIMNFSENMLEA
ncbi:phage tail sheath family protein [Winogradskyella schleiferi]|uniref:phage tail sheath family protein n=1 Tax=Winogradskyella schleiferi TaxID=2686078 RepID=UPI0015BCF23F|nr:phage tail sheath C-terminal domain-containing protein [Winogradskyella schleiferi]